jgi:hypothetical protein
MGMARLPRDEQRRHRRAARRRVAALKPIRVGSRRRSAARFGGAPVGGVHGCGMPHAAVAELIRKPKSAANSSPPSPAR